VSYPAPERVYLAAKFSRQDEMRNIAGQLRDNGFLCDPAWLGEAHDLPVDAAPDDPRGSKFAADDWHDLRQADTVICFTEKPGDITGRGRGGRHVEMGLALAWEKRVLVVGYRENVFCWLPQVDFFSSWRECQAALLGMECAEPDSLESLGVAVL
jgi:hypothetical protein